MARWTFAGSGANVAGPFLLSLAVVVGLGWRGMFIICALISGSIVLALLRQKFPTHTLPENNHHDEDTPKTFRQGWQGAVAALKRPEVIRWLVLLEFSDFMLDILFGFLALYFVDVVGASDSQASLAVGIGWGIGLIGDFLIIPLLERINGLRYLRYSAALELVLFTGFLLAPGLPAKVILISSVAFFSAGWYSILKGELYTAMRGQSGTVMAINTVSGLFGSLIPITLGAIASQFGLGAMMWVLLAGPIAFLIGLPRGQTLVVSAALVE
jgi:FSR family fosmidomycin resistance protein-like MFS transporter